MRIFLILMLVYNIGYASDKCLYSIDSPAFMDQIVLEEIASKNTGSYDIEIISSNIDALNKLDSNNLCIKNIDIDTRSLSFKIITQYEKKSFIYHGKYNYKLLVPILNRTLEKNEKISKSDITYAEKYIRDLNSHTVTNENEIIGKAGRLNLKPDMLINDRDLIKPIIVSKGSQINVIFEKKLLKLKITALALENGAIGDLIKVKNIRSNNIFSAIVTGENIAEVK